MKTLKEVKAEYLATALSKPVGAYIVKDACGKIVAHSNAPFPHSFDGGKTWIEAAKSSEVLFQSADGVYYSEAELPEQSDAFVTERYSAEVKRERNARISDTDDYIRISDITVQREADGKREALSEDERAAVLEYRAALRDLPDQGDFPFVEYPVLPKCIALECQAKIEARKEIF